MSSAPTLEPTRRADGTVNPAATFADFVTGFRLDAVPGAVRERAKLSLLDGLGIGLAAVNYDFARRLAAALEALAGTGEFPVIGMDLRLPLRDAAHLNGTLIHGLDFDDTHGEAVVHTTASAAPTALVGGLAAEASGADALGAFIIASECASRIGAAARGGFHEKGFHPTGVVGAFGATLGAGYLQRLSREQLLDAQGIVLSKAGGSMQFLDDGAWTKRNHPGWASACAFTAVAMARHGYFGPRAPYHGRYGLFPLHTRDGREIAGEKLADGLGERWEMANIAFKPYPACHMIHAFADAALALKRAHGFDANDVTRLTCLIHENEVPVVCEPQATKQRPQNAYDAQFSLPYVVATALLRGGFGLADLEDEAIADPRVLGLCERIDYRHDPESAYPGYFSGAVEIELADGRVLEHREQMNRGSAENPLSVADVREKFRANAALTLHDTRIAAIESLVLSLEEQPDLKALAAALST